MLARYGDAAFGWVAAAVLAAAGPAQQARIVSVRCVGPGGEPAEGAIVHLLQLTGDLDDGGRFVLSGRRTTDRDGRATFDKALTFGGGVFDRVVHARIPGQYVGAARVRATSRDGEPAASIEVLLVPSESSSGVVTVPPGARPADVRIQVSWTYHGPDGQAHSVRMPTIPSLRRALPSVFEASVDSEGRFELPDLPRGARLYVRAEGPGLAPRQWSNVADPPIPLALDLEPECVLVGQVMAPGGASCPAAEVTAWYGANPSLSGTWQRVDHRVIADANGRFRIGGLPAIDVHVEVATPGCVFVPEEHRASRPGVSAPLRLRTVRGFAVVGEVMDVGGGGAVEGALLEWRVRGASMRQGIVRTDDKGRFDFVLPAGPITVRLLRRSGVRPFSGQALDVVVSETGTIDRPLRFEVRGFR
ncbi:MAG: hypothetical protein CMJ47_02045 [Planctomyces sp.]|nr:hypothetical protein [Planctomyces sp.]